MNDTEGMIDDNPAAKRCKTVRIASNPQVVQSEETLGALNDQDLVHGWWQPDEYESSKSSARLLCREMRKMEGRSLSDAYDRACTIASSGFDLEAVQAAQILIPNESLVHWCKRNERGLERWTCRSYAISRCKDATNVKNAVLLEQARQFIAEERDEEAIARASTEKSRTARAFAALLGQADAAAARQENQPRRIPLGKGLEASESLEDIPLDPVSDESSTDDEEEKSSRSSAPIFISIKTIA